MAFYIDSANRNTGNCWPAIATTARKLEISERAVKRANTFWRRHGWGGDWFLTVPRRGKNKPTKVSNAYHVGWRAFLLCAADLHYCPEIRAEAQRFFRVRGHAETKSGT